MIINHLKSATTDITKKHFFTFGKQKNQCNQFIIIHILYEMNFMKFYEKELSVLVYVKQFSNHLYHRTKRDLIMTVTSS